MATKINTDFYGAENTFIALPSGNVKTAPHNLNWYGNNNIYTGGDWDKSAAPWGIGRSSLSSNTIQVPSIGQTWTITQHENEKVNNPLFMYRNTSSITGAFGLRAFTGDSATWSNYAKALYKCRFSPDAHTSYNTVLSDLTIDANEDITIASCYDNYPICYADYSKLRLAIGWIQYKPTNSDTMTRVNTLAAFLAANNCDYVTQVTFDIYNTDRSQCGFYTSIGGVGLEMPDIFKSRYYGENTDKYVRPWRFNDTFIGNWSGSADTEFARENTTDHFSYTSAWETLSGSNDVFPPFPNILCAMYTNMSKFQQNFDDVSYHWEYGICPMLGVGHNFDINPIHTGDTYTSGTVQSYCYMELDSYGEGLTRTQAYAKAILHEMSFMGFAVVGDVWDCGESIGSNKVYLPVFDEHMITTGEYIQGADSLSLPNATWGDVFSVNMPDYDPDYKPPEPEHDNDRGDLYNQGARRFFWNSLKVHLLSAANYDQFIQKLNSLNMTDPDNETWQLQFKGLNPSDYIVGAYASFVKPPKNTASTIMLGPVDMEQTEYTYKETDSNAGFFTFGTRDIIPEFNDFRDFAPYTMIELYLPLCGTIELDTAYFMGASVKVDYYYDIYTMSCTACIYRVKTGQELLYKAVNGTIGAQIPMLSANMGAYQNQIKSIENALKQNELKVMTSTAALAAGIVAAPMTSGASLIAAGTAALSGAAGLMNSIQKQSELEYQIEHIQPSISVTGAADPQTNICTGQLMPKLIIKRAEMLSTYNQAEYAKTIGHACCINDTLGYIEGDTESPRSGLVVCSSVDTSGIMQMISESDYISPTADEVNMIKQALSSGVIL